MKKVCIILLSGLGFASGIFADADVRVIADKSDSEIYVNGEFVGTYSDTPFDFKLPAGDYKIEVKRDHGDGSFDYFKKEIKVGRIMVKIPIKATLTRSYTEKYYLKRATTTKGAKAYLNAYPSGKYSTQLKNFIETEYAKKATTIDGAEAYLEKYPNGKFSDQAQAFIEEEKARIAEEARIAKERIAEAERKEREQKEAQIRQEKEARVALIEEEKEARRVQVEEALKKNPFIQNAPMELVFIPAGSFMMGRDGYAYEFDCPAHRVTLSKPFWMAKTEVTQAQYEDVMGKTPSYFKGENLPVEWMRRKDAFKFCKKLTKREQKAERLPKGWEYTLPTEAQWEYACRAGTTADISLHSTLTDSCRTWGDACRAGTTSDYKKYVAVMAWHKANSGGCTHSVGTKLANAWGLYDMHGNVSEYCRDGYIAYTSRSVTDPYVVCGSPVARGGSYRTHSHKCTSSGRSSYSHASERSSNGFRPIVQQK